MDLLFDLIKIAFGTKSELPYSPSAIEWNQLFNLAAKQTLIGVCFAGVQKLRKEGSRCIEALPSTLFMKWLSNTAQIQRRNEIMNRLSADMWKRLDKAGLKAALLKGQGIALLYGELASLRQSGDIDMWVKGGFDRVYEYIQHTCPSDDFAYHRFHYDIYKETEVELHFRPTLMRNLCDNRKLQKWCDSFAPDSFILTDKGFAVPSASFNRVFILTHIYRHFLFEGVGLRQVMDYFFVLKADKASEKEKVEAMCLLEELRMKRFAGAVMWVLHECLGLSMDYLLCPPDEKEGRFLLSEIEQTGNFGKEDKRYKGNSKINMMAMHGAHLLMHYPSEVVWTPIWLVYHKIWRAMKRRRINKIIRHE